MLCEDSPDFDFRRPVSVSSASGCMFSCVVTVGNKRDAGAAVRRSDSRSFKHKHDGVIACTFQVRDNVGSGNAQDSRYVFSDNPTRRKFGDNPEHFGPKIPRIAPSQSLACG